MGLWTVLEFPESQAKPAPRGGQASVSIGQRIICFSGADRLPTPFSDIWVLQSGSNYEWLKVGAISSTGDKLLPRIGSTMCAVGDIIYIYGGQDPVTLSIFDDVIALDTNSWKWAQVEVPGVKPPARHSHCAGVLNGRSLVIFGGAGSAGILGDLWIFDTFTRIWSHPKTSGAPASPREMHTGTMVSESLMVIFGGRSATSQVLSDVAAFDGSLLQWRRAESTDFPRCSHSAVAVPKWATETVQNPDAARQDSNRSSLGPSNAVLAFGGFGGSAVESSLLCIDAESLRVREVEPGQPSEMAALQDYRQKSCPQPRFGHSMATVTHSTNLDVVVIAGVNSAKDLNEVAVWRPTRDQQPALQLGNGSTVQIT